MNTGPCWLQPGGYGSISRRSQEKRILYVTGFDVSEQPPRHKWPYLEQDKRREYYMMYVVLNRRISALEER